MRAARKPRQQPAKAPPRIVLPRLVMLSDALNPDGLPRAGLMHPGAKLPVVFPNLPAALAALNRMEARA